MYAILNVFLSEGMCTLEPTFQDWTLHNIYYYKKLINNPHHKESVNGKIAEKLPISFSQYILPLDWMVKAIIYLKGCVV